MINITITSTDTVCIAKEISDLIPNFLVNRKKELISLKSAATANNFSDIATIAHGLKGASGSYGFALMSSLAKKIELSAKDFDSTSIESALNELFTHFNNLNIIYTDN